MDPYRAGIEIAEELAVIAPEIVFLFSSIHYEGSVELLDAIYDFLENEKIILIGNTGDGFYEQEKVANAGVSALAINSGSRVSWHLASVNGVENDPGGAARCCVERVNDLCKHTPAFYFMVTDFRTDTSEVLAGLREAVQAPIIGGSAADDFLLQNCFVYCNREVLADSIVILAAEGDLAFDISVAQSMQLSGRPGTITACSGTRVDSIDNISAMQFIEQEIGKPLNTVDEGVITLKLMESGNQQARLRSLLMPDADATDTSMSCFGGVESGSIAQVCIASPEQMVADVNNIAASLKNLPFEPLAALIITCAGRKKVLGSKIKFEVEEIVKACPSLAALAGFPSFGEFGPVKEAAGGYSRPLFHNMTYILLLIGDGKS
jgi:hypothetical protein